MSSSSFRYSNPTGSSDLKDSLDPKCFQYPTSSQLSQRSHWTQLELEPLGLKRPGGLTDPDRII